MPCMADSFRAQLLIEEKNSCGLAEMKRVASNHET